MSNAPNMSTPVTHAVLRAELAPLATKDELQVAIAPLATKDELREQLDAAIAPLVTKTELEQRIAQLATKADLRAELDAAIAPLATKAEIALLATKVELETCVGALFHRIEDRIQTSEQRMIAHVDASIAANIAASEKRLHIEFARLTRGVQEWLATTTSAVDEKYADLPGRVKRLETKVFPRRR